MKDALKCSLLSLALLSGANAWGQIPALANCTRSANLLACIDAHGNAYSVNTVGNTIYLGTDQQSLRPTDVLHRDRL
jgi:hypothetical protein